MFLLVFLVFIFDLIQPATFLSSLKNSDLLPTVCRNIKEDAFPVLCQDKEGQLYLYVSSPERGALRFPLTKDFSIKSVQQWQENGWNEVKSFDTPLVIQDIQDEDKKEENLEILESVCGDIKCPDRESENAREYRNIGLYALENDVTVPFFMHVAIDPLSIKTANKKTVFCVIIEKTMVIIKPQGPFISVQNEDDDEDMGILSGKPKNLFYPLSEKKDNFLFFFSKESICPWMRWGNGDDSRQEQKLVFCKTLKGIYFVGVTENKNLNSFDFVLYRLAYFPEAPAFQLLEIDKKTSTFSNTIFDLKSEITKEIQAMLKVNSLTESNAICSRQFQPFKSKHETKKENHSSSREEILQGLESFYDKQTYTLFVNDTNLPTIINELVAQSAVLIGEEEKKVKVKIAPLYYFPYDKRTLAKDGSGTFFKAYMHPKDTLLKSDPLYIQIARGQLPLACFASTAFSLFLYAIYRTKRTLYQDEIATLKSPFKKFMFLLKKDKNFQYAVALGTAFMMQQASCKFFFSSSSSTHF